LLVLLLLAYGSLFTTLALFHTPSSIASDHIQSHLLNNRSFERGRNSSARCSFVNVGSNHKEG